MSVSPSQAVKRAALHVLRVGGVFGARARAMSGGLRILCYHGISLLLDEHRFRGKLFMRPELFRARMSWLAEHGYRVLGLDEAVDGLKGGRLPERAVVITFDDGWYGCYVHAFPILDE